ECSAHLGHSSKPGADRFAASPGNDDGYGSAHKRSPEQCRTHDAVDDGRCFVGVDSDRCAPAYEESRVGSADPMLTVGIERLPFDPSAFEPSAQCRRNLPLKCAASPPQVDDRREAVAGVESDHVDL